MHSNGTLPLDVPPEAPLDARCGYVLKAIQLMWRIEELPKGVPSL